MLVLLYSTFVAELVDLVHRADTLENAVCKLDVIALTEISGVEFSYKGVHLLTRSLLKKVLAGTQIGLTNHRLEEEFRALDASLFILALLLFFAGSNLQSLINFLDVFVWGRNEVLLFRVGNSSRNQVFLGVLFVHCEECCAVLLKREWRVI